MRKLIAIGIIALFSSVAEAKDLFLEYTGTQCQANGKGFNFRTCNVIKPCSFAARQTSPWDCERGYECNWSNTTGGRRNTDIDLCPGSTEVGVQNPTPQRCTYGVNC